MDRVSQVTDRLHIRDTWAGSIGVMILFIFTVWQFMDVFIVIPLNMFNGQGPGNCANDNWIDFTGGIFSNMAKNECPTDTKTAACGDLGSWKDYEHAGPTSKPGYICAKGANLIYKDAISDNKIGGYNAVQLLSYIIIPCLTLIGITYGLIFTRSSYAEWIFWILIATLIYTGLTSISYTTNIDVLPPDQPSPLTYITDKLDFQPADELKYSFMARKADGTQCLIEGVMLGGGVHSQTAPATYQGTGKCSAEDLPLG